MFSLDTNRRDLSLLFFFGFVASSGTTAGSEFGAMSCFPLAPLFICFASPLALVSRETNDLDYAKRCVLSSLLLSSRDDERSGETRRIPYPPSWLCSPWRVSSLYVVGGLHCLQVANAEEEEAFADALDRFAEHLNSKKMLVPQDPGHGTAPTVSFALRRKFPKVSAGGVDENNGGECQAARNGRAESATATASSRRRSSEYSGRGGERKGAPPMGPGRRPHGGSAGGEVGAGRGRASGGSSGGETSVAAAAASAAATAAVVDSEGRDDGPATAR